MIKYKKFREIAVLKNTGGPIKSNLGFLTSPNSLGTLGKEVFAGIKFREFGFTEDFAGINFRELSLTRDFAGINFRENALFKDLVGVNLMFAFKNIFSTTLVCGFENNFSKN